MSAGAALALAGCGGGGGGATTSAPPDTLAVRIDGSGYPGFRLDLVCGVADRATCTAVLDAVGDADPAAACAPREDDGGRIEVTGTIGGARVSAVLRRRTTCEIAAYDRVIAALGL